MTKIEVIKWQNECDETIMACGMSLKFLLATMKRGCIPRNQNVRDFYFLAFSENCNAFVFVPDEEKISLLCKMAFNRFDLLSEIQIIRLGCDDKTFIPPLEDKKHYFKWMRTYRLKW